MREIFAEPPNGAGPIWRCLYINKIYRTSCQKIPSSRQYDGRHSHNPFTKIMFLVWITWLCNCIETVRSGFSFQLQNVLGGATPHSVYLLCPSTTNSSERHLLVRFPEPLFGLSKKGNLTRHLLPSGACFNLARLGQHHNETSA